MDTLLVCRAGNSSDSCVEVLDDGVAITRPGTSLRKQFTFDSVCGTSSDAVAALAAKLGASLRHCVCNGHSQVVVCQGAKNTGKTALLHAVCLDHLPTLDFELFALLLLSVLSSVTYFSYQSHMSKLHRLIIVSWLVS